MAPLFVNDLKGRWCQERGKTNRKRTTDCL